AFGAVEPWSIAILQMGAVILFLLWSSRQYLAHVISLRGSPLFFPISFFAAVVAAQILFGTSAYSHATISQALNYFAFALLIFLAAQSIRSEEQYKTFATALAVFG